MKMTMKIILGAALGLLSAPALAQNATVKVPMCLLQYQNNGQTIRQNVPCTGVVPVDSATGDALSWQDLFDRVASAGGNGSGGGLVVNAGSPSAKAGPVQNADGSKLATDAQLGTVSNKLTTLTDALGSPFQAGSNIGNTVFGATQSGTWNVGVTGPVAVTGNFYQATQPVTGTVTANLGTVGGLATDSNLTAVKTALGSPFQAGGTIGNTAFGIAGTLPAFAATPTVNLGTIAGAATDAKVEAVRALLAGTIKVDNGVALDGSKNATMNLSTFDRQLLSNVSRGAGPVSSFASMTVGVGYDVGNGIGIACTADGNVVLQGFDDTTITVPVSIGYNQFAFAIKRVVSQTATCTFTRLS